MTEEWRAIPGYEGYYDVSNKGNIRSWHKSTVNPKPIVSFESNGYMYVNLMKEGTRSKTGVHRIVLSAFIGPSNGLMACHSNGDPKDNRLENLRWDIQESNLHDRWSHGTMVLGSKHHFSVLTEKIVTAARKEWIRGSREFGSVALARKYGVSQSAMHSALTGKTWTHIDNREEET